MSFEKLNLIEPILKALKTEGYTKPTAIQEQAIPIVLKHKDLLGCAQTGTGKTAAFAIPILQILQEEKTGEKGQQSSPGNLNHWSSKKYSWLRLRLTESEPT